MFELFGLHLEGLWWWMDNLNRVRNFRAVKAAKARQGYAVTRAPIGYVRAVRGKWIKDPDVKVQEAVRRVFDLYLQLGSLGKVMRYLREHRLLFPGRVVGEVVWEPPVDLSSRTSSRIPTTSATTYSSGSRPPQQRIENGFGFMLVRSRSGS